MVSAECKGLRGCGAGKVRCYCPDTAGLGPGGGSLLEGGDFCLAQHLGELGDTLNSNAVAVETVRRSEAEMVRKLVCHGVMTERQTHGAAAHLRMLIFVWLSTSASLMAPSGPMLLSQRLQRMRGWGK